MVLVTGGAGYIGSHMCKVLRDARIEHVVFDNLEKGHERATGRSPIFFGDLRDRVSIDRLFSEFEIDSVLHFAAYSEVGESVKKPSQYYRNNVGGTLNLLEAMARASVEAVVFSSSAAVYGEPDKVPITEGHATVPTNPYGRTKLQCEQMLADFDEAYGLRYVALRYFNAAGCDPDGRLGEDHRPETHLIPNVLLSIAGKQDTLKLFGNDYNTPDGTCVRDYVHVMDVCAAHLLALKHLQGGGKSRTYNLGTGSGHSVKEVIKAAEAVTKKKAPVQKAARRPGDPAQLVASADKIKKDLKWKPKYTDLKETIGHAWQWMREFPGGYDN
ncbi:MAG: UDP-glucose 4-epimerase GalE [Fimbriimonadaceae bacterium]